MKLTPKERALTSLGVFFGIFLAAIEGTVVATAMPSAVKALGGISLIHFVFASYQLAATVSIPIWGKLGDRWGLRPTFLLSCSIFLLGSMVCGTTHSLYQLIAARFLQGLGAGAIYPLSQAILGAIYTEIERAKMQIFLSLVWAFASVIGPPAGALITENLSWHWVFYLNVPGGITTIALVNLGLKNGDQKDADAGKPFDWTGSFLMSLGFLTLLAAVAVDKQGRLLLTGPWILSLLSIALICFWALYLNSKNTAHPILPVNVLKNDIFKRAGAARFFMGMAMFGSVALIPLFCQIGLQESVAQAGRTLTCMLFGWVASSAIATRLYIHIPLNRLTAVGTACLAGGYGWLALNLTTISIAAFRGILFILGMGMGMCFAPLLLGVQASINRKELSSGTASLQLLTNLGGLLGVALLGTILSLNLEANGEASALAAVRSIKPEQAKMLLAMSKVFLADTLITLGALTAVLGLPPLKPKA